ncbi:hypothetical protein N7488_005906 [Penicillium malachiteum]|nr:hypothetical protein N7488_005906 [Penicillium malachiteum]
MSLQDNQSMFVVVTGNPQVGQGQRLSQIRSRNAKKHHERRIARYNRSHSVEKENTPVRRVVSAAVSHPVLMSAKILNASAWDDLMAHDRIESLTFEQSLITRYLLAQAMHSRDTSSEVKLAALVAILLFDMVAEDSSSFERDGH